MLPWIWPSLSRCFGVDVLLECFTIDVMLICFTIDVLLICFTVDVLLMCFPGYGPPSPPSVIRAPINRGPPK